MQGGDIENTEDYANHLRVGERKMGAVHVNSMKKQGYKDYLVYVVTPSGVSTVFEDLDNDLEVVITKKQGTTSYVVKTRDPSIAKEIHELVKERGKPLSSSILKRFSQIEIKVIANE